MKIRIFVIATLSIVCAAAQPSFGQMTKKNMKELTHEFSNDDCHFIVLNDAGMNGYGNQKVIADVMGETARIADAQFVISAGDQLHFNGVQSTSDPIWITNFETIYTAPSITFIPWYVVSGNHEYHGNVQALIDYSNVSARWNMPARYYTFTKEDKKSGAKIRFIMLDTTPMQVTADSGKSKYSDSVDQDVNAQIEWLKATLDAPCDADWTVVVGHHPVYANTEKTYKQQKRVQECIAAVFDAHPEIDYYICGHIHSFQHIVKPGKSTEYIVNTSAGKYRTIPSNVDLKFGFEDSGFLLASFNKEQLSFNLIDKKGKLVYTARKQK